MMMSTLGSQPELLKSRYKEHLKAPSPIFENQNITDHTTTVENFKIISQEGQNMAKAIKEAIYIRVNNPVLNKNIGKYNPATHLGQGSVFYLRTKNHNKNTSAL